MTLCQSVDLFTRVHYIPVCSTGMSWMPSSYFSVAEVFYIIILE